MQAEGRRSRGGRSVASDSGGRFDCRASPRRGPKTSAPRPLRAGRAHRALKAPEGRPARGGPRRGSRRAVVEAAGSVPSDEAGAREPRGRHRPADPKSILASPPRLFRGRGPPRARARGGFRRARIPPIHPGSLEMPMRQIPPSQRSPEGEVTRATPPPSSSPPRRRSSATPPRSRHRSASSRSAAA